MILVQQVFSYVLSAYGFRLLYCLLLYTTRCTTPAQYLFLGIAQYNEIKIKESLREHAEGKLGEEFSCLIHSNSKENLGGV